MYLSWEARTVSATQFQLVRKAVLHIIGFTAQCLTFLVWKLDSGILQHETLNTKILLIICYIKYILSKKVKESTEKDAICKKLETVQQDAKDNNQKWSNTSFLYEQRLQMAFVTNQKKAVIFF